MTAYDVEPLETIRAKVHWQQWALENEATLIFQRDAYNRIGKLALDERGRYQVIRVESGSMEK